jgi:hypothetical protein
MSSSPSYLDGPDAAASAAMNGPDADAAPQQTASDQSTSAPDQQQATPQPASTPEYMPSPDQDPNLAAQISQGAGKSPSLFRSIVLGALSGVATHLKGAGEGLVTGGIPGAIQGAVDPKNADQKYHDLAATQHAAAQSAVQQVAAAKDDHDVQMAQAQIHLAMLQKQYDQMPADFQEQLGREAAEVNAHLQQGGLSPVAHTDNEQDAIEQVKARMQVDSDNPVGVVQLPDGKGGYDVFEIPNNGKLIEHPVELTIGFNADGSPITKTFATHTISVAQRFALESAAMADQAKSHLQNQKNQGTANTAQIRANAAANKSNDAGLWLPKVSADEKKKAELAENIAFNANEVSSILLRRPDLVGTIAGRVTNIQQAMGNNDPDISAIATHIHNMAMANSGVHGFRSQEGVESWEKQVLNNFKNGPRAVAGALRASVGSVQTFIDNARPENYKTHSKQGGASRGMMGGKQ